MNLHYSPEEISFRDEVRSFLDDNLPASLSEKVRNGAELGKKDFEQWHAILNQRGWLAHSWPAEFGGPGWNTVERHIFDEESSCAGAPKAVPFGLLMLGPVLIKFGNDAQRSAILPRILSGEDWWCQGYSEPGAGSDLASLKTRAVRDGGHYVINGQKTWTTLGQHANKIFCLVRTSTEGKPQEGISFVLVDMDTPGVELRPIRLLDGCHDVNEVFFTDVRVPIENLVGEENAGWTIAKYLLTHERTNIAGVGLASHELGVVRSLTTKLTRNGKPVSDDLLFAVKMAEIETDLEALRIMNLRMLSAAPGGAAGESQSSMLKIKGAVIRQSIHALARMALGPAAAPWPADELPENALSVPKEGAAAAATFFNNRKLSIFGGSNEIQRNIIAKDLFRS